MNDTMMWSRISRGSLLTLMTKICPVLALRVGNLKIHSWRLPMWEGDIECHCWSERVRWRRDESNMMKMLNQRRWRRKRWEGRAWKSIRLVLRICKRSLLLLREFYRDHLHKRWWINWDICKVSTSTTLRTMKSCNLSRMFSEIVFSSARNFSSTSHKRVFQKMS